MKFFVAFIFLFRAVLSSSEQVHDAVETEMFSIPISPNMFNWTYQEFDQQYRFHASLEGRPELPSWLRYIYSGRHHSGFIFGTPPQGTKSPITLEVIGLNRQDYETRRLILTLKIKTKENKAKYEVELKIDNLNVEDLLDQHRMQRLKEIFKTKLWTESDQDLHATFLASAIDLGARLPLKPNEGEGLVIRLGSSKPFSTELKRLREEVRPLSRLPSCPREYKRTTVERLFRDASYTLDWCNFELYNTFYNARSTDHIEYLAEIPSNNLEVKRNLETMKRFQDDHIWTAPSKHDLPKRSYVKEYVTVIAVPLAFMLIVCTVLTAVICVRHVGIANKLEMCRYETRNTENTQINDNVSSKSLGVSPNNSLVRPYSPKSSTNLAGSYNRPQPPPYLGSNTNSLHHRKSCNTSITPEPGNTDNKTHLALEQSLKLLNEAKLADYLDFKNPVLDLADGTDDYVPIKRDFDEVNDEFRVVKEDFRPMDDLDNIVVPELGNCVASVVQEPPVKTWFC